MSRSYTDSLDFTHLEGETEDSADLDSGNRNNDAYPDTDTQQQPTISLPPPPQVRRNQRSNVVNQHEVPSTEAAVIPSSAVDQTSNNNNLSKGAQDGFEDSFVNGPRVPQNTFASPSEQNSENGVESVTDSQRNPGNEADASSTVVLPSSFKIHYDSSRGNIDVLNGQVTTRPDGSQYINTQGIPVQWEEQYDRPLRKKRMRLIKIFSIIACVFFFPTGIPAIYYAFRTEKEFDEGVLRGNIDRAQKFAKRSERLIVLSFVLAFMVAALILAIVERPHLEGPQHHHTGTIAG